MVVNTIKMGLQLADEQGQQQNRSHIQASMQEGSGWGPTVDHALTTAVSSMQQLGFCHQLPNDPADVLWI
jgi:hypothetical protein